jgi:2-hydroxy-3-keto-5-methylthiopentenyl-1-phosphate phosphatase
MSPVIVLDFDGTVTMKDVGDEVCDRFAPPLWREIDARWVRNEISLPEAQRQMWALARCSRKDAIHYSRDVGEVRPGLDSFLDAATKAGARLWLASGGFDFYIEAILGERLARFERAFFNRAHFSDGKIELEFHEGLSCEKCAVCKGRVCELARAEKARVVFVGDGASDRCAIGKADLLCAVEGSMLARGCDARGVQHRSFSSFSDLVGIFV